MKQSENISIDSLQMPASSTLELFGRSIPVQDYSSVGEAIELEELLKRDDLSALEQNIEAVAIVIRHRTDEVVSAQELKRQPLTDIAAFEEAVNVLIGPFASAYAAAAAKRTLTLREGIKNALRLIGANSKVN